MLQPKLTSEPREDLKGAYVKEGEFWVLDKLAEDHPKMVENKRLIDEKRAVETERDTFKTNAANAEQERDEFKNKAIPHGYKAAKANVVDAGEAAIAAGFTAETVKTAGDKITSFETKEAEAAEKAIRQKVAQSVNKEFDSFDDHATARRLNFAEKSETIDGKNLPYFVVVTKDAEGKEVETRVSDYVKDKSILDAKEVKEKGFQFSSESGSKSELNPVDIRLAKYAPPASAAVAQRN